MPIARWVFAALLLSMALGQSLSLPEFVNAVGSYRVAGEAGSSVLAWVLLLLQALAGAGLLWGSPRLRPGAGWAGLAVALAWSALAVQAFARGLSISNCGCFGRFLAQELSWWVLLQDAYFVVLALLALRSARRDRLPQSLPVHMSNPDADSKA